MGRSYDCIVLGTGGAGSAALYHLARRGVKVLGIDRFPPGHDRGSSHGDTRIIRQAYFEHPDYVPLLFRAYDLWAELEKECGRKLYYQTGLLQAGPENGAVVPGVLRSAAQHKLAVQRLTADELEKSFPGFRAPDAGMAGVFEQRAGYLLVEECVRMHIQEAQRRGASLRTDESALGWREDAGGVIVRTNREEYAADRLVIAAGPWAPVLLEGLGVPLQVRRKPLFWFESRSGAYRETAGCPCFLFETSAGVFYGFPERDLHGVKVAEHTGGSAVSDPLNVDRELDPADQRRVEGFLDVHMPEVGRRVLKHTVCMYTLSPDEHFIIDRHPEHPQVVFAAGLSGHGFKFTCVIGEILADLALLGKAPKAAEFLAIKRLVG